MLSRRMTRLLALFVALCMAISAVPAQNRKSDKATVQADDLQKWLSYLASDELEGRATFSEGLGLAAAYLAEQLRSWGVKPGGDNGSYFQRVRGSQKHSIGRASHRARSLRCGRWPRKSRDKLHLQSRSVSVAI